jgi:hypothetical protein
MSCRILREVAESIETLRGLDHAYGAPVTLRPLRACAHPSWIAALLVLALNDRYFKSHGLPALSPAVSHWVVGKASDFAGLFVVLPVAATLFRVRTERALGLVLVTLGALFAALKTSAAASALYEAALAPIGARNVVDPSDLMALPMLFLSAWLVVRTGRSSAETDRPGVRWTARIGALVAAPFCLATSAPPPPPCAPEGAEPGCREAMSGGQAHFVGNPSAEPLTVRVRAAAVAQCTGMADPCATPAWTIDEVRTLPPGENTPLPGSPGCMVYAFDLGDEYPTVVLWAGPGTARVPREATQLSTPTNPPVPGGLHLWRKREIARAWGNASLALCPEVRTP